MRFLKESAIRLSTSLWLATMLQFLHMGKPDQAKPSPLPEAQSGMQVVPSLLHCIHCNARQHQTAGSTDADRGMIPRAISLIFKKMAADTHQQYNLHISYMEIYNSTAYDLLDPSRDIKELSDLPPVTILEDDEGRFHMRQLSLNACVPPQIKHKLIALNCDMFSCGFKDYPMPQL